MKKMNILIIPSWYPNEDEALSGCFFKEQAIALAKAGHKVTVLNAAFQDREHINSALNYRLRKKTYDGVVEYAYNVPGFGVWRNPWLCSRLFLHNIQKIWRWVKTQEDDKYDVIHVHSFYPAGMAAINLSMKEKIPLVYTEHSSALLMDALSKEQEKQIKALLSYSSRVVSVSHKLKLQMEKYNITDKQVYVLPNMVDTSMFHYMDVAENGNYVFLTVGRLNQNKRIDWVIRAFSRITKIIPKVELRIVGDGEEKEKLIQLVEKLQLNDKVIFKGMCPRKEVAEMMCSSDCFVLDSRVETFGVVYIEAMACGLPTIIPKWNSSNMRVTEENAVLIEEDNLDALAEAMQKMYKLRNTFDKKKISKDCIANYSGTAIANKLTDLYVGVYKNRNEIFRE